MSFCRCVFASPACSLFFPVPSTSSVRSFVRPFFLPSPLFLSPESRDAAAEATTRSHSERSASARTRTRPIRWWTKAALHWQSPLPLSCRGEGRTIEWRSHWSGVGWRWRWRGRAAASLTHSAAPPAQSSAHSTGATIEGKELKKREGADQVLYPSDTCTRTRKVHLCTTIIFVGREQWTRNTVMR